MDIVVNLLIGFCTGILLGIIYYILHKTEYHGPNSKDIVNLIFKNEQGCFKLKPVVHFCPISKSMSSNID